MNCLIIEENAARRQFLQSILEPHAVRIMEATDLPDVIARLESFNPDWVILNLEMRGIDGMGLVRSLNERNPQNRTIVLSSYNDADLKRAAFKAGAFGFVMLDDLVEVEVLVSCLSFKSSKRSYS